MPLKRSDIIKSLITKLNNNYEGNDNTQLWNMIIGTRFTNENIDVTKPTMKLTMKLTMKSVTKPTMKLTMKLTMKSVMKIMTNIMIWIITMKQALLMPLN